MLPLTQNTALPLKLTAPMLKLTEAIWKPNTSSDACALIKKMVLPKSMVMLFPLASAKEKLELPVVLISSRKEPVRAKTPGMTTTVGLVLLPKLNNILRAMPLELITAKPLATKLIPSTLTAAFTEISTPLLFNMKVNDPVMFTKPPITRLPLARISK